MNYKETLFFVGKCLTITLDKHSREMVTQELMANTVDWDSVVKLSTAHYVFPALYCNLKRTHLLKYLPDDLVAYMEHITNLNRERNQQIIAQAQEINTLLLANTITPIFLKGTGNLLEGLYEDIGERMVGDIDFIVDKSKYQKTIDVLKNSHYDFVQELKYYLPYFKHYPRICRDDRIAAVEVHKEMTIEKYANEFNFLRVKENTQFINNTHVLSFKDQLCLSIIAKQINDNGYLFKNIALRNAYDVFLLSKKTEAKNCFDNFEKLKEPLNSFLAMCFVTLGHVKSLAFHKSKSTDANLIIFDKLLTSPKLRKRHKIKKSIYHYIRSRYKIIYKSLFDKSTRQWLYARITDREFKKQLKKI